MGEEESGSASTSTRAVRIESVEERKMTKSAQKFHSNFSNFFRLLATTALTDGLAATTPSSSADFPNATSASASASAATSTSAILDVELVATLIQLLTEIVGVGQPDIRYAASLAIFEMGRGALGESKRLTERRGKAERQRRAVGAGTKRGESLASQVKALDKTISSLTSLITTSVIPPVFMHRYRDSSPPIRSLCISYLSHYQLVCPESFLVDAYLKYPAWLLHDSDPSVRQTSLKALNAPFLHLDNNPDDATVDPLQLKNVAQKFLPHLADLTLDVSGGLVQEEAGRLLGSLLREGFMDEVEDEELWDQINFRSLDPKATPEMRRLSLQFVIEQLEAFDDGSDDEDDDEGAAKSAKSTKASKKNQKVTKQEEEQRNVSKIDALASWAAHAVTGGGSVDLSSGDSGEEIPVSCAYYMMESLRSIPEFAGLATAWPSLLHSLTADTRAVTAAGETSNVSDLAKQRVLTRMLMAAVKLECKEALGDSFLEGTMAGLVNVGVDVDSNSKKKSKKGEKSHTDLSNALLPSLPSLLSKFAGDNVALRQLAQLPRYLSPDVLGVSGKKKEVTNLLNSMVALFERSGDDKVLGITAGALRHLAEGGHARSADAKLALQKIADKLKAKITDHCGRKLTTANVVTPKKGQGRGKSNLSDGKEVTRDTEFSLGLSLQQFRTLSKRMDVSQLVGMAGESSDASDFVKMLCGCAELRVDKCTEQKDEAVLRESVNVVCEALEIGITMLGWMVSPLHEKEDKRVTDKDDDFKEADAEAEADDGDMSDASEGEVDVSDLKQMRECVVNLSKKIFELVHVPASTSSSTSSSTSDSDNALSEFIQDSQEVAMKTISDLRSLLPKSFKNSSSEGLRALAFTEDGQVTTGMIRFAKVQEEAMRLDGDGDGGGDDLFVESSVVPQARAVLSNWEGVNRREAGCLLGHFTGFGKDASDVVKAFSAAVRKRDEVKLLEVHMASLRQSFEAHLASQPKELTKKKPSEAEMAAFTQSEADHNNQYADLVKLAVRMSKSLGVNDLKTVAMKENMVEFIKEAIRYSFSCPVTKTNTKTKTETEDKDGFGSRISFLGFLKHYVGWVKKDTRMKNDVLDEFYRCEDAFKSHLFYLDEEQQVAAASGKEFLNQLGAKKRVATATVSDNEEDSSMEDDVAAEKEMAGSKRTARGSKAKRGAKNLESVVEDDREDDPTTTTGTTGSTDDSQVKGLFDKVSGSGGGGKRRKTRTQ